MEYINHYTLWTNHMRRTYTDEVSEESRKMIREYIKFDGRKPSEPGMCRSYEVPFMDGTDLKLGIRSGFYDATITKNIQGEKVPLFMTCGCRDKSELSNAMNLIKMIYESITGTKLAGFAPLLPFIVDIPIPSLDFMKIAEWTGDFSRCMGWIFLDDDAARSADTDKKRKKKISNLGKRYYKKLPEELEEFYDYLPDCGHSIMAIPECILEKAIKNGNLDLFVCPFPVKYVLEKGYRIYENHVVCDAKYREDMGLMVDGDYDEF